MRDLRIALPLLLLALVVGCGTTPSTPTPDGLTESGTVTIRKNEVLLLANGISGEGTLIFQGWQYPFTIERGKIEAVSKQDDLELQGKVYNLQKIEDFAGTYEPSEAEYSAGEGFQGLWAKNEKDVVIRLSLDGQDARIKLESKAAIIALK